MRPFAPPNAGRRASDAEDRGRKTRRLPERAIPAFCRQAGPAGDGGERRFRMLRQAVSDAWERNGGAASGLNPWPGHTCSSQSRIRPTTVVMFGGFIESAAKDDHFVAEATAAFQVLVDAQEVTHEAMRGPSAWSAGDRELMAAFVAKNNECEWCTRGTRPSRKGRTAMRRGSQRSSRTSKPHRSRRV